MLSHMHHGILINMPYHLLRTLQNMAYYARRSINTQGSVINHGLINLLSFRALEHRNLSWEKFVVGATVGPIAMGESGSETNE